MENLEVVGYVHFGREKKGKKRLLPGRAPEPKQIPKGNVPRLARLMALAPHFEELLERREIKDMAEIARYGHVSRARVTQIMNLRFLAPDIQEAILNLPNTTKGCDNLLYRHVHPLTVTASWKRQREMWANLADRSS